MVNEQATGVLMSSSPEETRRLASALGTLCRGGELLLLFGDLGAGKTCFVQGLAVGLEVDPRVRVASPTFTLHGEYQGRLILNHLDLYRIEEAVAVEGLGLDEMLCDKKAVSAIEWPEIMTSMASNEKLEIRLNDAGDGCRQLLLEATGTAHVNLLRSWLNIQGHSIK